MNIEEMSMNDVETRSAELRELMNAEDADIDALTAEVEKLEARKAQILKEAEERKNLIEEVEKTAKEVESFKGEKKMELKELRNTKEYAKAYATYLLSGYKNDAELRRILTNNGLGEDSDGVYHIPTLLETKIQTAWENDEIVSRLSESFFKGNLKVMWEVSATGAVFHAEGSPAPYEEQLILGHVELVPVTVKKWLYVTTEVYEMGGEEFIDYIYDEITYRIVKALADAAISAISNAVGATDYQNPGVASLTVATLGAGTIAQAEGLLSAEATDLVAIMSRATWAQLKAIQANSGNNVGDPFDGMTVLFSDAMSSFDDSANTGNLPAIIVGDLKGVRANYPNGKDVRFVFDDKSKAEEDLVKIVGRLYVAVDVVKPMAFCAIRKSA